MPFLPMPNRYLERMQQQALTRSLAQVCARIGSRCLYRMRNSCSNHFKWRCSIMLGSDSNAI